MDAVTDGFVPVPPPSGFVPPATQSAILAAALGAVRKTEGERRWTTVISQLSGWIVAAAMVVPLGYSLSILKNRPVPQDKIWVALMHSDGTTEAAKPVEDLTPSQREAAVSQFIFNYVEYRMGYDLSHYVYNFQRTLFMTAPVAQGELEAEMKTSPDRPTLTLGQIGERRISDVQPVRVASNAFDVTYTVRIRAKEGQWLPESRRRAHITYAISASMPAEVARRLDPLKLVVIRWEDHPATYDPTAPGGAK